MANILYGGDAASFGIALGPSVALAAGGTGDSVAIPDSPGTLTVWDALTSGTQVTALRNEGDTSSITVVTPVAATGRISFRETNGTGRTLYLDAGTGPRYPIQPADAGNRIVALEANPLGAAALDDLSDVSGAAAGANGTVLGKVAGVWTAVSGAAVADHGSLTGLTDDDHTQYYNQARGDARYSQVGHTHSIANVTGLQTSLDSKAAVGHTHSASEINTGVLSVQRAWSGAMLAVFEQGAPGSGSYARPSTRVDLVVAFIGQGDPGSAAVSGVDLWLRDA